MTKKYFQSLVLLFMLSAIILAAAPIFAQVQGGRVTVESSGKTDLTGEWQFRYGCESPQAGSIFKLYDWQMLKVPMFWPADENGVRRTGCYRLALDIAGDLGAEQWAVRLGRVRYLYRLYLNGQLIGGNGQDNTGRGEGFDVNHHRELCFLLPEEAIKPDGENYLELFVDDLGQDQGGTQGRAFFLASRNEMRRIQSIDSLPVAGLALIVLVLIAYFGYLYFYGGRLKYVGQFGLLLSMFGLPMMGGIVDFWQTTNSPIGNCLSGLPADASGGGPGLIGAALYLILLPLLLVRFCKTFFELPAGKAYRLIHILSAVEIALLAVFGGFGMVRQLNQIQFAIVLLVVAPYLIHGIGSRLRKRDRYATGLVLSLVATVMLVTGASLLYSLQLVDFELDRAIPPVLALLLLVLAIGVRRKAGQVTSQIPSEN